ncbi:SusD/RagB family nutrient-binding outer membrane lipoprotein [Terrimonas pollutisoli]|uniref:SusD/RagB family nutrient-binding outer membrane lipoprotein n=1 Tax=Terrimonas pollutisoli TaxID=3034147 RepID=UPI0023EC115D|nr:SusD/RagB family nutrient-binding outer membrane lipoprotein [Terrimonas sp. H1YJ31]
MKKIFIIVAACGLLLSCNKFKDINVSPTQLTSASTKGLLTNSLQQIPILTMGNDAAGRLGALYVQHLSEGPYPASSLYSDRNLNFAAWYTGPLYNLQTIINYNNDDKAEAANNGSKDNQIAVARILKAYYYLLMTDKWGDIPYSEALQGNQAFSPKYDKQQDIYTALFKELTEAVAQIKENEAAVVGDILLNGDMAAWKRFANTQRMIMALRLSEVDPTKGKAEYAAAIAAGVISSNAQNISYKFLSSDPNNYNPWYNNYTVSLRNDYAISKTLTDYMSPKNDPRLPVYGEVLAGSVVGLQYGRNQAVNIPAVYSRIGNYFRGAGSSMPIFNYAQVLFGQAEAAKIGYTAGGDVEAELKYLEAIKASWEQHGVFDAAKYATYVALPEVAYTPADGLKKIITEKWVHGYLNSWEVWSDWRRTGFPVLTPAVDATDARGIPLRIGYPANESALNGDHYKEAVTNLGGKDDNYAKMWWVK